MMRGMYAAISGLEAHQTMLDVTANNLANVDTVGYKAQRTQFAESLSQSISAAAGPNGNIAGLNPVQVGLGVAVGSIDNLMGTGSLQTTGNPTDVAIQGDGFLRVSYGNPPASAPYTATFNDIGYTRAGDLTINPNGFLQTQTGSYVVGKDAQANTSGPTTTYSPGTNDTYIKLPTGATGIALGPDGSVSYLDQTSGLRVTAGYLSLATFPNEAGLEREGGTLWKQTSNSGNPNIGTPNTPGFGQVISGSLEMSNVDMATEFTNMIQAERGYQANASTITTADQMMQTLVQMKP